MRKFVIKECYIIGGRARGRDFGHTRAIERIHYGIKIEAFPVDGNIGRGGDVDGVANRLHGVTVMTNQASHWTSCLQQ